MILIIASGCETESSRNLSLNNAFLSLKPTSNYSKQFANASGDTVNVAISANIESSERLNDILALGAFGDVDFVNGEKRDYTLSCDSPYIHLNYSFFIRPNGNDERSYSDWLILQLEDSTGSMSEVLTYFYQNDTLYLGSSQVFYSDTLNLISNSFTEVFGPFVSSIDQRMFYYKPSQGLLGFRTAEGVTYELVN
ncbi:MAG: hypothetical protein NXI09_06905 [Bacteroidetes bacterium]|nr:hypothetical protein [Bacteroidota bacterium]